MEMRVNQTQERKSKKVTRKMEKRANESQEESLERKRKDAARMNAMWEQSIYD